MTTANPSHQQTASGRRRSAKPRLLPWILPLALLLTASCAEDRTSAGPAAPATNTVYNVPRTVEPTTPLPRPKPERPRPAKKAKPEAKAKAPSTEPAEPMTEPATEPTTEPSPVEAWKFENLVGMTEPETRDRLGSPSFEEEAAPAKIWLYTAESCSVRVYFFPEVQSLTYRVLRYEVLGAENLERCVAEIRKQDESGSTISAVGQQTS